MSSDKPPSLRDILKRASSTVATMATDWVKEREIDQKRLDWIGTDLSRHRALADELTNHLGAADSIRDVIDHLMKLEFTP